MASLLAYVPELIHITLRESRYYAKSSDALVIQADDSRKQADNADLCFQRLYQVIKECAEEIVPGETSEEQKKRVLRL